MPQKSFDSFESRTVSFSSANPIRRSVSRIRELQAGSLPNGGAVREAGERRSRELLATGEFSLSARG